MLSLASWSPACGSQQPHYNGAFVLVRHSHDSVNSTSNLLKFPFSPTPNTDRDTVRFANERLKTTCKSYDLDLIQNI